MIEQMFCDDQERIAYRRGTPEFDQAVAALEVKFGPIDAKAWESVSTPQYNSIFDDDVVSVVFGALPAYLETEHLAATGRKYFLNKGWVYDKIYTFTKPADCRLPYPSGATPMFIGKLVSVYGQPGDADLTHHECLYFMHLDHAAVEAWAGKTLPQGQYDTFYAATYDTADGNRLERVKTYCYDEQGIFTDWEVVWLRHAKRLGCLDEVQQGSNDVV